LAPLIANVNGVPKSFLLNESGLYKRSAEPDGEPSKISGPIWIEAIACDLQKTGWGAVTKWIDRDGELHEQAISCGRFHEKGTMLAQDLAGQGLLIVPGLEARLIAYLASFDCAKRLQSSDRLGWLDTTDGALIYITPRNVISNAETDRVIFQPERFSPTSHTMISSGTLDDWQTHVVNPCQPHPYLIFALCVPFSGPLLKAARLDSGGFHLYGRSSHGKTTAAQVSASVWGCGADPADAPDLSFIRRWNATANAIEGLAAAHNDNLLVLDELGTCAARDFGKVVYDLAGGQGKAAMDASRNLKKPRSWRITFLSTGELSGKQKIEEDGTKARAGQLLRMLDIPISDGAMVADADASTNIDRLKRSCSQYYGTAGSEFVKRLIAQFPDASRLKAHITETLESAILDLSVSGISPEQSRALKRFALVRVAGLLAMQFGILNISVETIEQAVAAMVRLWLADSAALSDVDRGLEAVRQYILKYRESRFTLLRDAEKSVKHSLQQRAGWLDDFDDGTEDRPRYLLLPQAFQEACAGFDADVIARELLRRGLLHRNNGSDRLRSMVKVPGTADRLSVYAVKAKVLNFDAQPE
jgi:putative DNA primase/helicase